TVHTTRRNIQPALCFLQHLRCVRLAFHTQFSNRKSHTFPLSFATLTYLRWRCVLQSLSLSLSSPTASRQRPILLVSSQCSHCQRLLSSPSHSRVPTQNSCHLTAYKPQIKGRMAASNNKEARNSVTCAACQHQGRKCREGCILAPFFPSNKPEEFQATLETFGIGNMSKHLNELSEEHRGTAAESFIWEALAWKTDPIHGPLSLYRKLVQEGKSLRDQISAQRRQIELSESESGTRAVPGRGQAMAHPNSVQAQQGLSEGGNFNATSSANLVPVQRRDVANNVQRHEKGEGVNGVHFNNDKQ
ncbi:DUF260 domain-containing protein, partial [Cephalotus follicularis]